MHIRTNTLNINFWTELLKGWFNPILKYLVKLYVQNHTDF